MMVLNNNGLDYFLDQVALLRMPLLVLVGSMVPLAVSIRSMRAGGVAAVRPATSLVTFHHLLVLCAFCLLFVPIRIWARLVARLILATCCVAQHMVCETLELLHGCRH